MARVDAKNNPIGNSAPEMSAIVEKNFEASPPATDGARELAADLLTDAALARNGSLSATEIADVETAARQAFTHDHHDLRTTAVAALAMLDRLSGSDLRSGVTDPSSVVRRRTVEAVVERLRGPTSDPAEGTSLVQLLTDRLGDVSVVAEVAAFGIGELGPDRTEIEPEIMEMAVAELVRMATDHDDPLCRESAIAALGALHRQKDTVLAGMDDKATVRRRAVLALAPFEGPDVTAAIEKALTDRDWQVRQAAEDQMAARSPDSDA